MLLVNWDCLKTRKSWTELAGERVPEGRNRTGRKDRSRVFAGVEYLKQLKSNYPAVLKSGGNAFGFVQDWLDGKGRLDKYDCETRFVPFDRRSLEADQHAWKASTGGDLRWAAARTTYKGLIILKPPFDLVLYSNLIWELQPQTILEFGALQGGSSLWFADQLDNLCQKGEVHSFELLTKCIHRRARLHPKLHFHEVNLLDLRTLNKALLDRLPHPWLVIDDAHVNIKRVVAFVAKFMRPGDYYVWEDILLPEGRNEASVREMAALAKKFNLLVDVKYTDAFGRNVTCSPNSWLRKSG
jgi:cephalosporin hydroxylase